MESMGVASGCGCKELYRFHHIYLIPTPLVSALFCSSIPTFCSLKKCIYYIVDSELLAKTIDYLYNEKY